MDFPIIGIIGLGKYGTWFKSFFEKRKFQVIGSDISVKKPSNEEVVKIADIVLFAVSPIEECVSAIKSLTSLSHPDQLWMDVTSLKEEPVRAMLLSKASVVGLHPMCTPPKENSLRGNTLVFCPERITKKWAGWVTYFLTETQAQVVQMGTCAHDQNMAVVQGMVHTSLLSFAATLKSIETDVEETLALGSPLYRVMFSAVGRMLSQDPKLYADLLISNPYAYRYIEALQSSLSEVMSCIREKNPKRFEQMFADTKKYLDPVLNDARVLFEGVAGFVADISDVENRVILHSSIRNEIGLLWKIMGVFSEEEISLNGIHSLPDGGNGDIGFVVDFYDSKRSPRIMKALKKIKKRWHVQVTM